MSYWNRILIEKLFSESKKNYVKYKLNTDIGRFYFYFKKEKGSENKITGKLIFYPDLKQQIPNKP
jgi:hypothetical protein